MQNTLRITAGKYKNKSLELPSLATTRATKSIVKGSVFDRLQFRIYDSLFVELFAGSGSMGLEALSRGAKKALFIEKDRECLKVLKKNIASIDKESCTLFSGDTFSLSDKIIDFCKKTKLPTFLYVDPPFDIRKGSENIYQNCIKLIENLDIPQIEEVIIEHSSKSGFGEKIASFTKVATKRFGATSLSIYKRG